MGWMIAEVCEKKIGCDPYVFVHARRSIVGVPPIRTLTILDLIISMLTISMLTISTLSMRTSECLLTCHGPGMLQRSIGAAGRLDGLPHACRQRKRSVLEDYPTAPKRLKSGSKPTLS